MLFSVNLPAIADTNANAYAGGPEADAGARTVVPIAIAAALDVSLARRIIVGIFDNHAAPAAGAIATSVLIADQPN